MNQERPTPETDKIIKGADTRWRAHSRRLEQERDEAREIRDQLSNELHLCTQVMAKAEDRMELMKIRHAAAMLHTQTIVDQSNALREAAIKLLPYLPDMEPVGPASHSEHNKAAWNLRQVLKAMADPLGI